MVHNLGAISIGDTRIPDWAKQFEQLIKRALLANDHETILNLDKGQNAQLFRMSHPSIEHFLPLVYLLSVQDIERDKLSFLQDEYELGSICMLHVLLEDSAFA
jgi:4,5-DOPA dioxygenase extradiol